MSTPFVVVITGASSGIGRELAKNLAAKPHSGTGQPYAVVLTARREEELKAAVAECNQAAGRDQAAAYVVADVSKQEDVAKVAEFATKTFGRVDVWVNNAGRALEKRARDLTPADIESQMSVNVYSALFGSQAALKLFAAQEGSGQIINVSSVLGRNPTLWASLAGYSGSKHFLNSLTDNLRQDVQSDEKLKDRVVVTLYSPGVVATDIGANSGCSFDSHKVPNAQPVEEVGESLRKTIETRVEEVYSRDAYKKALVVDFFAQKA